MLVVPLSQTCKHGFNFYLGSLDAQSTFHFREGKGTPIDEVHFPILELDPHMKFR